MENACDKILPCGHLCCGFSNEKKCLPCLNSECVHKNADLTFGQNEDSYCTICGYDRFGEKPCVQLDCHHIFHYDCVLGILEKKWPGPRIIFKYLNCTSCNQKISCSYSQ